MTRSKLTAIILAFALSLALFACSPAESGDSNVNATSDVSGSPGDYAAETSGELVWTAQNKEIDLGKGAQTYNAEFIGDKLYYSAYVEGVQTPEAQETEAQTPAQTVSAFSYELRCYDTTAESYSVVFTYTGENYPQFLISSGGHILLFTNVWDQNGAGSSTELAFVKADGTLSEAYTVPTISAGENWYNAAIDDDGNVYLTGSSNEVAVYSFSEEKGFSQVCRLPAKYAYVNDIVILPDGSAAASTYSANGKYVLTVIDLNAKTWGAEYTLSSSSYNGQYCRGNGEYFLYYSNQLQKFVGYNENTKIEDVIFDWFDLDTDLGTIHAMTALGDGTFRAVYAGNYDQLSQSQGFELITFSKQPKSVSAKTELTYATLNLSMESRNAVLDFNRKNSNYRIKVKTYGDDIQNYNDIYSALLKLNTEIIAGNIPDIIDLSSFPADIYAAKGLLADLYRFIDSDAEFTRNAFIAPILKAAETDGKLYSLPLSVNIQTYMGKKSVIGGEALTYERLKTLMAENPDAMPIAYYTKEQMLQMIGRSAAEKFINRTDATCNFDSADFIALLELCNSLPADMDALYVSGATQSELINSKKALLVENRIYNFTDLQYYHLAWQDDIVYAGLPEIGNVYMAETRIGIAAKSAYQEGAWEYVRSMLDMQANGDNRYYFGFPVTQKAFDRFLKEESTETYTIDENGEEVPQWKGGRGEGNNEQIFYYAATPEEVAQIMDTLNSTTRMVSSDSQVEKIISEECGPLFAGQKSAAETAKVIQSRVSIYVAEQQ
ncbi:MAG: hypothetical protein LBN97_05560 [Oscillospiraceae bacterium]|nr:hypothetical protein [Oscillospiraceae bacterium]